MSNSNSNVVKLKKKKPAIDAWKAQINELSDKFAERLNDAVRLADDEAIDEGIPEDFAECAIVGVLASILVQVTESRNVIGPEALIKLVEYQIHAPYMDEDDAS